MNHQQIEQLSDIIKQNVTIDKRNIENLLDFLINLSPHFFMFKKE